MGLSWRFSHPVLDASDHTNHPRHLPLFAIFSSNVMWVREEDDTRAVEAGIRKLEAFYASIKMPANLREAGVKEEDLEFMAEKAVERGNLGILTSIGKDEALQIMRDAF